MTFVDLSKPQIQGTAIEPKGAVVYDPVPGVSTVDLLRVLGDLSTLLRVPIHNQNPTGIVDLAVMAGPDPAYAMLKSNIMGYQPGVTDRAWHDYRSDNAAFQIERRVQGSAIDRFDRATNLYTILANLATTGSLTASGATNLNGTTTVGGATTFSNTIQQQRNVAGLNRVTFQNPNTTTLSSRCDVGVLTGAGAQGVFFGGTLDGATYLDSRPGSGQACQFQHVGNPIFSYNSSGIIVGSNATPAASLHLDGTTPTFRLTNTTTGVTATDGFSIGLNFGGVRFINHENSADFQFHINSSPRFTVGSAECTAASGLRINNSGTTITRISSSTFTLTAQTIAADTTLVAPIVISGAVAGTSDVGEVGGFTPALPVGIIASAHSTGASTMDVRFTNVTPNPITIPANITYRAGYIKF